MLSASIGLAVALAAISPAPPPAAKLKLGARSALPGELVTIAGKGVKGKPKRIKATVGGKKAPVVKAKRKLRLVVPQVKPGKKKVVVRAGKRRLRGSLRVKRGFGGEVEIKLDSARAVEASIGPGGGTVAASGSDGTAYTLTVPAGALPEAATITMTPVAQITNLPFGGKSQPVAVQFGPEGLKFDTPASLRIDPAKPLSGKVVGFDYTGNGTGLGAKGVTKDGNSLIIPVEHFSGGGGAETRTDRDFFILIGRLATGNITLQDVELFVDSYGIFQALFGRNFCVQDVTCAYILDRVRQQAILYGRATCPNPNSGGYKGSELIECLRLLLRREGDLQLLGSPVEVEVEQRRRLLLENEISVTDSATRADLLAQSPVQDFLTPRDRAAVGLQLEGFVNNGGWALYLATLAEQQGFADLRTRIGTAFSEGLAEIRRRGEEICKTDQDAGEALLRRGLRVAELTEQASDFLAALQRCGVMDRIVSLAGRLGNTSGLAIANCGQTATASFFDDHNGVGLWSGTSIPPLNAFRDCGDVETAVGNPALYSWEQSIALENGEITLAFEHSMNGSTDANNLGNAEGQWLRSESSMHAEFRFEGEPGRFTCNHVDISGLTPTILLRARGLGPNLLSFQGATAVATLDPDRYEIDIEASPAFLIPSLGGALTGNVSGRMECFTSDAP